MSAVGSKSFEMNGKSALQQVRSLQKSQASDYSRTKEIIEKKMEQNILKNKLKHLYRQIDSGKTGSVNSEVFFEILNLHHITL